MNSLSESDLLPAPRAELALPVRWLDGGTAITTADGGILSINPPLAAWLERTPAELTDRNLVTWLTGRFPAHAEELRAWSAGTEPFGQLELKLTGAGAPEWFGLECARHGATCYWRLNSALPPLAELEEAAWDEYLQSERARRQMFVRLLRAEAQLQNLTQRWPGVIFNQRADFSFQFVSPTIETWTGVPVADWRRQPQRFWQLVHEADAEELQQQLQRAHKSPPGVSSTYRIRHAQTGRITYLLEHRQALVSQSGLVLGYEGVWLDVTRQTIAEKRLSTAAWKETLSLLTMGLAHDFGNVMAGIHSLAEGFLSQIEPGHEFLEGLTLIRQNSMQASQLVHRIINLHHGKTGERNYHDLNELVTDLTDLIHKILPRRIQISSERAPGSLPVYVDDVEFRQVVINLALNAADAMPQRGTLVLRTSTHAQLPPLAHAHGKLLRLPALGLSVTDTGTGIKARHLASLFDPFFTTKSANKGSGLGLYNARLFTEKHHGLISVDSVEGQGSTFSLWLPQADFTEADRGQAEAGTPAAKRYSLLLAGQAGLLLDSTAEWLRSHSYHVVTATTAEQAAELLSSVDYQFNALLVLAEPTDTGLCALLIEAARQALPVKRILQIVGQQADALDNQVLGCTDLVIPPEMAQTIVLEKLTATLADSRPPGL